MYFLVALPPGCDHCHHEKNKCHTLSSLLCFCWLHFWYDSSSENIGGSIDTILSPAVNIYINPVQCECTYNTQEYNPGFSEI